jgi:hypothetical protein
VYADTVEGDVARQLACRMALRMRGSKDENVGGNKLGANICAVRYPSTSEVTISEKQSSLGAWASAPAAIGGEGTPVITHEVSERTVTRGNRTRRSVEAIMPGFASFCSITKNFSSEAMPF